MEIADGSILAGTLPAGFELTLVMADGEKKIAVGDVRRLAVSNFREEETAALEAEVRKLREGLAAEDFKEREAASKALQALPGTSAPFVSRMLGDPDPEVVSRARAVLRSLEGRGQLRDSRDFVVVEQKVLRGWLRLEKVELRTALGSVEIGRAEIRTMRRPGVPEAALPPGVEEWLPPMAQVPAPRPPVLLAARLQDGSQLVGESPAEALALVDDVGKNVTSERLQSLVRDPGAPGYFQVRRKGIPAVRAALVAKELPVVSGARRWSIPVGMIESIEVGPLRPFMGGGNAMAVLVQNHLAALAQGAEAPTQRFWVYIDGQPANPWNSVGKTGMTWVLHRVHEKVCLVGADKGTNAYKGDTSIDEELPILAVRKRNLPAPEGVDPKDFYAGWIGGDVRLTKPVCGRDMTSLEAVNTIIREEFGDEWEVGEHHSPSGGWHWWAYWEPPPDEEK